MSEDKNEQTNNNDTADDTATLKEEIEQLKNEKAAIEMKYRKSDDDLYSEDYLEYLNDKKNKQPPQNTFMSGGRLTDYSEDEIANLPMPKLVGLIAGEVYSQIKNENQKEMTKKEMVEHKNRVTNAREEIKQFAKEHPDFRDYVASIDELSQQNPNLNIKQLYVLAGGKLEAKPPEPKPKLPPNTRATVEAGVRQSDKNLSLREVIAQEYQKLK